MLGNDERNHGSAELIPTMRDDESETNDAEMLNEVETMDEGEPEENENGEANENKNGDSTDDQVDGTAPEDHDTMEHTDQRK